MAWKRPTIDTPFQIDWKWWSQHDRNYRLYLYEQLCEECREQFGQAAEPMEVDWIDPETAEVTRADALEMCLRAHCVSNPTYIHESLPIAVAVFRVFLVNGNQPLSPRELHEYIPWRDPATILRVIGSRRIHYGIRAVQ